MLADYVGAAAEWRTLRPVLNGALQPLGVALILSADGPPEGRLYFRGPDMRFEDHESLAAACGCGAACAHLPALKTQLLADDAAFATRSAVCSFGLQGGTAPAYKFEVCAHCAFASDAVAQDRCHRWLIDGGFDPETYLGLVDLLLPGAPSTRQTRLHSFVGIGERRGGATRRSTSIQPCVVAGWSPRHTPATWCPPPAIVRSTSFCGNSRPTDAGSTGRCLRAPPKPGRPRMSPCNSQAVRRTSALASGQPSCAPREWLLAHACKTGGWSYNDTVDADANSTAWSITLLRATGFEPGDASATDSMLPATRRRIRDVPGRRRSRLVGSFPSRCDRGCRQRACRRAIERTAVRGRAAVPARAASARWPVECLLVDNAALHDGRLPAAACKDCPDGRRIDDRCCVAADACRRRIRRGVAARLPGSCPGRRRFPRLVFPGSGGTNTGAAGNAHRTAARGRQLARGANAAHYRSYVRRPVATAGMQPCLCRRPTAIHIGDGAPRTECRRQLSPIRSRVTYLNHTDFRARITDESKMFGDIIRKCNIKLM